MNEFKKRYALTIIAVALKDYCRIDESDESPTVGTAGVEALREYFRETLDPDDLQFVAEITNL